MPSSNPNNTQHQSQMSGSIARPVERQGESSGSVELGTGGPGGQSKQVEPECSLSSLATETNVVVKASTVNLSG